VWNYRELLTQVKDAAKKSVLVYDERYTYSANILTSLENLGVPGILAANEENFINALKTGTYRYVFVSPFFLDQAQALAQKLEINVEFVLLSDLGQSRENIRSLGMPAYTVSIANVLNGVPGVNESHEKLDTGVRFIAPEARVLVVDDINTNLRVVKGLMAPYEIQVDCSTTGAEAIRLVEENTYDIVFMDHMMPGMDGIETTAAIRSLGPSFQMLPIIALTANVISGVREMFIEHKMNDYLAKPIDVFKLNEILERWIPYEKRLKTAGTGAPKGPVHQAKKEEPGTMLTIEGIDTGKGLEMVGGSEDVYREVLDLYCKDVETRLDTLKTDLNAETLPAFITQVHALKSASASIGAAALSGEARALEMAGKDGDIGTIQSRVGGFTARLALLVDRIRAAMVAVQSGSAADQRTLSSEELGRLKAALKAQNVREIDLILHEFGSLPLNKDARGALEAVSDRVLVSEFDESIGLLTRLEE
jgi:CheY-like chemotaxis protein